MCLLQYQTCDFSRFIFLNAIPSQSPPLLNADVHPSSKRDDSLPGLGIRRKDLVSQSSTNVIIKNLFETENERCQFHSFHSFFCRGGGGGGVTLIMKIGK